MIDWLLVGKIAGPVALLIIGALINRWFERKAILYSYFVHTSAVRFTPQTPDAQPSMVHTHAVALKNQGKLAATNVRLHHLVLPDFTIFPSTPHTVETLADGKDIVIAKILPKEYVQITYLYFPPLVYTQINAGIKSDQGFARQINALMQRQYPQWVLVIVQIVFVVGAITLLYLLWAGARALWTCALCG